LGHIPRLVSLTHDPKGKRIAWARIKKEKRPKHVAIVEIRSGNRIVYALEIERTNQEHAILIFAAAICK
jgi:hypothetical protein